jgi:hypothetical protein
MRAFHGRELPYLEITMDDRWQVFVLRYDLERPDTNNIGELQNLYDEGWRLVESSDEIVHKGIMTIIMHLTLSKYGDDHENSA